MTQKKRPLFTFEDEEEISLQQPQPLQALEPESEEQDVSLQDPVQSVVLVDVDIPLSRMALFFLKALVLLVPFVVVLGVALHFVLKVATLGDL